MLRRLNSRATISAVYSETIHLSQSPPKRFRWHRMRKCETKMRSRSECDVCLSTPINRNDGKFRSSQTSNLHVTSRRNHRKELISNNESEEISFFFSWRRDFLRCTIRTFPTRNLNCNFILRMEFTFKSFHRCFVVGRRMAQSQHLVCLRK